MKSVLRVECRMFSSAAATRWMLFLLICFALLTLAVPRAPAQQVDGPQAAQDDGPLTEAERRADEALADDEPLADETAASAPAAPQSSEGQRINWLELLAQGGPLMWPIGGMSIIVVAFASSSRSSATVASFAAVGTVASIPSARGPACGGGRRPV